MIKFDLSEVVALEAVVAKLAEDKALELTSKVTIDVHTNVVAASPVDTGNFRAAWTVETPTAPFQPGKVENNTVYGPVLVHGHSKKAADGWLENAVVAATKL